jgi:hypothetical protein
MLKVEIDKNGTITIALSARDLKFATENHPDRLEENRVSIANVKKFAKAVFQELKEEQEDGTTLVHEMFDSAIQNALEDGAEGVDFGEDNNQYE